MIFVFLGGKKGYVYLYNFGLLEYYYLLILDFFVNKKVVFLL